jgi:hypothetical protein
MPLLSNVVGVVAGGLLGLAGVRYLYAPTRVISAEQTKRDSIIIRNARDQDRRDGTRSLFMTNTTGGATVSMTSTNYLLADRVTMATHLSAPWDVVSYFTWDHVRFVEVEEEEEEEERDPSVASASTILPDAQEGSG